MRLSATSLQHPFLPPSPLPSSVAGDEPPGIPSLSVYIPCAQHLAPIWISSPLSPSPPHPLPSLLQEMCHMGLDIFLICQV